MSQPQGRRSTTSCPRGRFRSRVFDIELALEQTEIRRLGGLQRSAGCPGVNLRRSLQTSAKPLGFVPKSLKLKHFVTGIPKSLGQQALRKIRSLEHLPALSSPTRSTAASLKHRRCWAFPTRRPSLRIVVVQENGGGEGIRTIGTLTPWSGFVGCARPRSCARRRNASCLRGKMESSRSSSSPISLAS